jgi:hypothetical protein
MSKSAEWRSPALIKVKAACRDVLRRWHSGVIEQAVATDEGMAGPENGLQSRILEALRQVGGRRIPRSAFDPRQGMTSLFRANFLIA